MGGLGSSERHNNNTVRVLLGMVAHACNPSYLGGRDQETAVQGQPGQKVIEIPIPINELGIVIHIYNLSYLGGNS
jgi:hypothetical protein